MKFLPRMIAPLLAAGIVLTASAALAAPGIAKGNINVRSGPGIGYSIVDRLKSAEYVIVLSCGASWCTVHNIGPDGYVSRALIYNPYYGTRAYYQFPPKDYAPGR